MATAKFYGADMSALQQWFNVVDADRSGEVNTAELQQALAQGGLNFSMPSTRCARATISTGAA